MGQRQKILRAAVAGGITELRTEAERAISIRRRDLAEQMIELKGLRGKNTSVIKHMRARIEQEQGDFDVSGARIHAVRSVHLKLLREVFHLLGTTTLKTEMAELTAALRQPGIKLGVRKAYARTFDRLRDGLRKAQATSAEIQSMLTGTFRQLNAEYGFSLQAPREPDLARYERDLDLVERSHNQYLGVGNTFRLAQPEFADRLVRALATRLRVVYESALGEVELWNKSAAAQLDAQLRERRRNFGRRLEAIERIQQAASGLDDRIAEIEAQEAALDELDAKLAELTGHLIDAPSAATAARPQPPCCQHGMTARCRPALPAASCAGSARTAATACPGRTRATRIASGCPKSCCSRRRWLRCWATTPRFLDRFPDVRGARRGRARTRSRACGAASATTAARATCIAARSEVVAAARRRISAQRAGAADAARHRPLDRRGDRRPSASASGSRSWTATSSGCSRGCWASTPTSPAPPTSASCGTQARGAAAAPRAAGVHAALHPGPDGPGRHRVPAAQARAACSARCSELCAARRRARRKNIR